MPPLLVSKGRKIGTKSAGRILAVSARISISFGKGAIFLGAEENPNPLGWGWIGDSSKMRKIVGRNLQGKCVTKHELSKFSRETAFFFSKDLVTKRSQKVPLEESFVLAQFGFSQRAGVDQMPRMLGP